MHVIGRSACGLLAAAMLIGLCGCVGAGPGPGSSDEPPGVIGEGPGTDLAHGRDDPEPLARAARMPASGF